MSQTDRTGQDRGQEDMIRKESMNKILRMGHFARTLHLLVDSKVGSELESGLNYQPLLPQVSVNQELQVKVVLDLPGPCNKALHIQRLS